jgi:hypothetical protein
MAKTSRIGRELEQAATIRLTEIADDMLPVPQGKLCGRNGGCITPLEDRDGVLFCVNCGPAEQEQGK